MTDNFASNCTSSCQSPSSGDMCPAQSFGNYSPCPACGENAYRNIWNSQNTDACAFSPTIFYPEARCDYQERASRNIYNWKKAFDYGTNAAGCSYIGKMDPLGATFIYGTPSSMFSSNRNISYGSYVGALDRDRLTPYYDDKGPGACAGPNVCRRGGTEYQGGSSNNREYNYAAINIPYTSYTSL